MLVKVVFLSVFCLTFGSVTRNNRVWRDCSSTSSPVTVTNVDIGPHPLRVPGDMLFTIEGFSNQTLGSSRLVIELTKLGSWFNFRIPCIRNIGSCTYEDMCTLVDDMIRENWLGISGNIGLDIKNMLIRNGLNPELCPQPPQAIRIIGNPVRMPVMPSALYWFAEGSYEANVRVFDNSNDQELACMEIRVEMRERREECNGWFSCYF